jgi:hypothetical protein
MKKYLLLPLLCFCMTEIKSQSLMTVGEIYDYNTGDVFIKSGGWWAPPSYQKTIITNKFFSTSFDTVFYVYDTYYYQPALPCSTCIAVYDTTYGNSVYYTNLNDTVGTGLGTKPHYWSIYCIDTAGYTGLWVDSIYYDTSFCNILTTQINVMDNGPQLSDSCYSYFEPHWGYDQYGAGLGQRDHYYNMCSEGGNCEQGLFLIYYKKGTDSCGHAPVIPTHLDELKFTNSFKIFPNPSSTDFHLTFFVEQNNSKITIRNILGEAVKEINFSRQQLTFERDQLKRGMYFVQVTAKNSMYVSKLIIQ